MNEEFPQTLGEAVEKTVEAAEETIRLPFVKRIARFGFYAKALVFIVVGALAIMLSVGSPEGRIADPAGALAVIAQKTFGTVLLILFSIGAVGHGIWNLLRGIADVDDAGGNWLGILKRSIAVLLGIFYVGLALTAVQFVLSSRVTDTSSQAEETFAAILLAIPVLGAALLFLIGLGVIGAGFHECYSGVSGRFRDSYRLWEITGPHLAFITVLGVLSFVARAIIMIIMGYYFVAAALWNRLDGAIGIDASLYALAQSPYGRVFLFAAAVGLFAHGVLAVYEAKYRRIC